MKQKINPKDTSGAIAFEVWTKSPMPMVTFTKTFDVAVTDDLEAFNANYMHLTETISQTCQDILDDEAVIVGTGRYRKGWLKTMLPISFQFHHAQMDGKHAARFLEELQKIINTI